MPPKYHPGWEKYGFKKIYDENRTTVVVGAQCPICNYISKKKTEEYMKTHMHNHKLEADKSAELDKSIEENEREILGELVNNSQPQQNNSQLIQSQRGKKRSIDSESCNEGIVDSKILKTNSLLLKFVLANGLDIISIDSIHLKHFCEELLNNNSSEYLNEYPILSAEDVKTKILPTMYKDMVTNNQKKKLYQVLFVERHDTFSISYATENTDNNGKANYIYIYCKKNMAVDDFESFCEESIEKANRVYGLRIFFIVTVSELGTEHKIYHKEGKSYVSICFSKLLQRLHDIEPFRLGDISECHAVSGEYLKCLSDLECKVKNCSLGEATKLMLDLKSNDRFCLNESISDVISEFLSPISLTAVFLNHKYQMNSLNEQEQGKVLNFLDETFNRTEEHTSSVSEYILKNQDFRRIFEKAEILNPRQFWIRATLNYKLLASFALEFLAIPAILPTIATIEIEKILEKYYGDDMMKNLLISLQIEDAK